jgi:predicted transcriptional regulator
MYYLVTIRFYDKHMDIKRNTFLGIIQFLLNNLFSETTFSLTPIDKAL